MEIINHFNEEGKMLQEIMEQYIVMYYNQLMVEEASQIN